MNRRYGPPPVTPDWSLVMRTRVTVFALLATVFILGTALLQQWGYQAAANAYRSRLLEELSTACHQLRFGAAEGITLRALRATPEYRDTIHDALRRQLPVMPELRWELEHMSGAKEATNVRAKNGGRNPSP